MRAKLRKLERDMRGNWQQYFELRDGTRHYFDTSRTGLEMLGYFADSARAAHQGKPRPPAPPIVQAIAKARDRSAAFYLAFPRGWSPFPIFDVEALLEHGTISPREIAPDEDSA